MQLHICNPWLQVLTLRFQQNLYQVFLGVLEDISLMTSDSFVLPASSSPPSPTGCFRVYQTLLNLLDLSRLPYNSATFTFSSRCHSFSWTPPLLWSYHPPTGSVASPSKSQASSADSGKLDPQAAIGTYREMPPSPFSVRLS